MGLGVGEAAIIGAGINAVVGGANAYAQGRMNKRSLRYNRELYDKQRKDSLSDWAMQNEYNSPSAQMQRYRDAGLNPHLIYGQSNEGATVRSTDQQAWNPRAPQFEFDAGTEFARYYDTRIKEAQTDNLRAANTVSIQQAALLAAQTANTVQNTAKSQFELQLSRDLRETSLQAATANLRQTEAQTTVMLNQDQRNAAMTASNLKEAISRILKIDQEIISSKIANNLTRAQIDNTRATTDNTRASTVQTRATTEKTRVETSNLKMEKSRINAILRNLDKDSQLKQLDINLKKDGVQPHDPAYLRAITQWLEQHGLSPNKPQYNDKW